MGKEKNKVEDITRCPVVSILGHIDHGKTTLLDRLRSSDLQTREAGGITQHIGAYQLEYQQQRITFIDTPGHAAFAKMRARGVKITDLAILVVAGNEGVKPQTKESFRYIQQAGIPFLVAVTKMDLPAADINKVKTDLVKIGVLTEDRGGEIVAVPVSAQTGEGIEELLEMIMLLIQMQELPETNKEPFEGVVIESRLDRSKGPVATVLVKKGVLQRRDEIQAGSVSCRVRAMETATAQPVDRVGPGQAVLVLGFDYVPDVGELVVKRSISEAAASLPLSEVKEGFDGDEKKVALLIKADTRGTLEAVLNNLPGEVRVIGSEVGAVNENDLLLAQTTKASILGFGVGISGSVKKLAEIERVPVRTYKIIYELFDEVARLVEKKNKPERTEEVVGRAEIIKKFHVGDEVIAGGVVLKGRLAVGDEIRLERGKKVVGKAKITSLHQNREEKKKVRTEEEFGALFQPQLDFKTGDVIVSVLNLLSQE